VYPLIYFWLLFYPKTEN